MSARRLFKTAIYVNRATNTLLDVNRGKEASLPFTEHRPWVNGERLLAKLPDSYDLVLIFAHYETLTYWAIAREIMVDNAKRTTQYCFSDLKEIPGIRPRKDLIVNSTGTRLPNNYIRSYVLVKTPDFVRPKSDER